MYGASANSAVAIASNASIAATPSSSLLAKWWKKLPFETSAAAQMSSTVVAA